MQGVGEVGWGGEEGAGVTRSGVGHRRGCRGYEKRGGAGKRVQGL